MRRRSQRNAIPPHGKGGNQNLLPSNCGGVVFVHFKRWLYPLYYLLPHQWSDQPSRDMRGGWWRQWGQDSSPQLSFLWSFSGADAPQGQHFPPAQPALSNWAWPCPKASDELICSTLPAPVTNKTFKSFTSIKYVKQDQHFSHQMSNTSEADSIRSLREFLSSIIFYYKLLTRCNLLMFRLLGLLH